MGFIVTIAGSVLLGGAVATATVLGLVSSQTAPPVNSPTSVSAPQDIQYGNN